MIEIILKMKFIYSITAFIQLVILIIGKICVLEESVFWEYAEKFIFAMSSMIIIFSFAKYRKNKVRDNLVDFSASALFWAGSVFCALLEY